MEFIAANGAADMEFIAANGAADRFR